MEEHGKCVYPYRTDGGEEKYIQFPWEKFTLEKLLKLRERFLYYVQKAQDELKRRGVVLLAEGLEEEIRNGTFKYGFGTLSESAETVLTNQLRIMLDERNRNSQCIRELKEEIRETVRLMRLAGHEPRLIIRKWPSDMMTIGFRFVYENEQYGNFIVVPPRSANTLDCIFPSGLTLEEEL